MKKSFNSWLSDIQNEEDKKNYSGTMNKAFVPMSTPADTDGGASLSKPIMSDFKQIDYQTTAPLMGDFKQIEYGAPKTTKEPVPSLYESLWPGLNGNQPRVEDLMPDTTLPTYEPLRLNQVPTLKINNQFKNPLKKETTTNIAGMNLPKYTPPPEIPENVSVLFDVKDDVLTPQQLISKYSKVAETDNLSSAERNRLAKQGEKAMGKISAQQITVPFLRPRLNGEVSQDDIERAMYLQNELARQTSWGAGVLSAFNAASFNQLEKPVAEKLLSPKYVEDQRQAIQRSREAQPVASTVGSFAGEAAKYAALAPMIEGLPIVGKATQAIGAGAAKLTGGKLSAEIAARLAAGRAIDLPMDVIRAAQDNPNNLAGFAKQLGIDTALGLGADVGLEAIGKLWRMGKSAAGTRLDNAVKDLNVDTVPNMDLPNGELFYNLQDGTGRIKGMPDFYAGTRGVSRNADKLKIPIQKPSNLLALPAASNDERLLRQLENLDTGFTYPINAVSGGIPNTVPNLQSTPSLKNLGLPEPNAPIRLFDMNTAQPKIPVTTEFSAADVPSPRGREPQVTTKFTDADIPPARVNTKEKSPRELDSVKELFSDIDAPEIAIDNPDAEAVSKLTGRGVSYNKDFARNLDAAAGKDKKVRQWLKDNIETPFLDAKARYADNVKTKLDTYKKQMDALGIKKGSKESSAVQWIGEGVKVDKYGDPHEYTMEMLREEFPESWQRILQADKINRKLYDDYIQSINNSLTQIYPDAQVKALERSDRLMDSIHYTNSRIDELAGDLANEPDILNQAKLKDEISRLKRKVSLDSGAFNQLQNDIQSGDYLRNKRLLPRKDYYHHFQELQEGVGGLKNIISTPADIDPHLAGTSDFTQPKSKWTGFMQQRKGAEYSSDAVGGMIKYIPAAEYKVNIDPIIAKNRGTVKYLADQTEDLRNANKFIEWMGDWTNDLAGKTNPIDRPVQKLTGRKAMKVVEWVNNRVKSNAVLGNLNSAVSQVFNIPNAVGYIKSPKNLAKGAAEYVQSMFGNKELQNLLDQSGFLKERYLDQSIKQFDEGTLKAPRKFAEWLLNAGDEGASKFIWLSAYDQAKDQGIKNAVEYADDIARRAVAGRGIGELPITQKSKLVQLFAPFQVEVNNAYQVLKEKVKQKDALGIAGIFATTWFMNNIAEQLTGNRVGFDPIDATRDAIAEAKEGANFADKATLAGGRIAGEALSNMPYGATIAATLVPEEYREPLFGENDPTRFGTGNIGANTLLQPFFDLGYNAIQSAKGSDSKKNPDWLGTAANIALPWGGKQLDRSVNALQDMQYLPRFDGVGAENMPASYSNTGRFRFPIDTSDPLNVLKGAAFGSFATNEGKEYIRSGTLPLSDKATGQIKEASGLGISPEEFIEIGRDLKEFKPIKDENGKVITSAADQQRDLLRGLEIPPEQKQWLDQSLVGELKNPRDYSSNDAYILSGLTESQQKGYNKFNDGRFTVDEYVRAIDAIRKIKGKDEKLKAIRKLGYLQDGAERLYEMINYREKDE
ncbi:hypothetical protein [Marasmitruncus massiliensis]|uniref:hypothetical protein n=1 Tax=Marasmitruncus massiliensis TaxID=1944642 RepID=UPI000C7A95C4|nr:hypothetical protein [Marasmitruncus massiliensis]